MKYTKPLTDGDTFELRDSIPMKHICCDCGLVHLWEVKHTKNARVTTVTTYRDSRATGQKRKTSLLHQEIKQLKVCRDHWKLSYESLKKDVALPIHDPRCDCGLCNYCNGITAQKGGGMTIQRYAHRMDNYGNWSMVPVQEDDYAADFVLYTDHLAAMKEKDGEIAHLVLVADGMRKAANESYAALKAENKRLSDSFDHSRIKEIKDNLNKFQQRIEELELENQTLNDLAHDQCAKITTFQVGQRIKELEKANQELIGENHALRCG
jgi:hypothetical protein